MFLVIQDPLITQIGYRYHSTICPPGNLSMGPRWPHKKWHHGGAYLCKIHAERHGDRLKTITLSPPQNIGVTGREGYGPPFPSPKTLN